MQGRIWFEGNPWPNGHAIISANMHIFLVDGEDKKSPFDAGAYLNLTIKTCLLYTSPSPRDATLSRMPSSA